MLLSLCNLVTSVRTVAASKVHVIVKPFMPYGIYHHSSIFSLSSGPVLRHLTESSITTTELYDTLLLSHYSEYSKLDSQ